MQDFWKVQEGEDEEVIELPSEDDGSLLLTTLYAQFPGASGLKYKAEDSGAYRGIRLADGKLHPPESGSSLSSYTFLVVFPKVENKRKLEDDGEITSKKRDSRFKCSDLIVLGLPFKTDEDTVREYFQTYGELLLVQVKKNPQSGRSKGFGFIRFANIESQAKVICSRHLIDGRWCEVKIANAKNADPTLTTTKIFVGRLTEDITTTDLNDYFSKFGQVLDVYIPKPFRGFAFVNFADPFIAYTLCAEADDHIIKQVSVHVSKASPRGENKQGGRNSGGMDQGNYGYGKPSGGFNGGPSNYGGGGGNPSYSSGGSYGGGNMNSYNDSGYRSSPQNDYRSNDNFRGSGPNSSNRNMGGGSNGGPSPSKNSSSNNGDLTNLSALTPALIAAALNQAGLGNLLSSLQQNGKTEPPPPPPPSRGFSDPPPTRSSNWDVSSPSGWNKKDSYNTKFENY